MIKVNVDLSQIFEIKSYQQRIQAYAEQYSAFIAESAYSKMRELAEQKLHYRRELFLENLSLTKVDAGKWSIVLGKKAEWIEDGTLPRNMIPDLLSGKKAKTSKDGSKYVIVPFNHTKGAPTSAAQAALSRVVKDELRDRGLDKPLKGKKNRKNFQLGAFDVTDKPISTAALRIGAGPIGRVAQGAASGIPLLKGVQVYQKVRTGKVSVQALTFRTVSDKSSPESWNHPGNEPADIMKEAVEWSEKEAEVYVSEMMDKVAKENE